MFDKWSVCQGYYFEMGIVRCSVNTSFQGLGLTNIIRNINIIELEHYFRIFKQCSPLSSNCAFSMKTAVLQPLVYLDLQY